MFTILIFVKESHRFQWTYIDDFDFLRPTQYLRIEMSILIFFAHGLLIAYGQFKDIWDVPQFYIIFREN
jgi:hypothetical protein